MSWITDLLKEIPLSSVLKEKIATIEERYKELEAKYSVLEADNADLKRQLADSDTKTNVFQQQIKQLTHSEPFSERQEAILLYLFKANSSVEGELIDFFGISLSLLESDLTELSAKKLIYYHPNQFDGDNIKILPRGVKYLTDKGILN